MATMMNSGALSARYLNEHPKSTLTKNAIRVMLKSGCVPAVCAGNRVFYSYEAFMAYLERGESRADDYGKIRRIV